MKTLQEIKNEISVKYGFKKWSAMGLEYREILAYEACDVYVKQFDYK